MPSKGPTPKQHRIRLAVIPEPEAGTRSVMVPVGPDVMFVGEDRSVRVIMECGGCGAVLARGVRVSQLQNLVVQCFHCKAFNEVLGAT